MDIDAASNSANTKDILSFSTLSITELAAGNDGPQGSVGPQGPAGTPGPGAALRISLPIDTASR